MKFSFCHFLTTSEIKYHNSAVEDCKVHFVSGSFMFSFLLHRYFNFYSLQLLTQNTYFLMLFFISNHVYTRWAKVGLQYIVYCIPTFDPPCTL